MQRISKAFHTPNTPTNPEASLRPRTPGDAKLVAQAGKIRAAIREVYRDCYVAPEPPRVAILFPTPEESSDRPAWFNESLLQAEEIGLHAVALIQFIEQASTAETSPLDHETLHAEARRLRRRLKATGNVFKKRLRPHLYYFGNVEPETPAWITDERPVNTLTESALALGCLEKKIAPFFRPSMGSRIKVWVKSCF